MTKSHFPRECFPLSQILGSAFTSLMGLVPLIILFVVAGRMPKIDTLWVPLYLTVEVFFTIGIVLAVSAVIVQMRDLQQIIPIVVPLVMLATVLIPLSTAKGHPFGLNSGYFVHGWLLSAYCVVNPMVSVIDSVRGSVLYGVGPNWHLLGLASLGAVGYLVGGYVLFKKLEVNFADLS
jgi:ABC-2 type transport system permease protein/lipopolysaccharide transport system permease protein